MTLTNEKFFNAVVAAKRLQFDQRNNYIADKLSYAAKRFVDKSQRRFDIINDTLQDKEIEFCSTDEKGNVERDAQGNLKFTKEALRELKTAKREILDREITLHKEDVYICPDNSRVQQLAPDWEILNGLVFEFDLWNKPEALNEPVAGIPDSPLKVVN